MKIPFSEVFADETKNGTKLKTSNYQTSGTHPIIDQGQDFIAGYTDSDNGLYTDVPAIIFGDHTRVLKYVDFPFFLGADGAKILKARSAHANYKYLYYALKSVRIPDTGYNRHFKWLKEAAISIPGSQKQESIVFTLDSISRIISHRKSQLAKLDELVKCRFVEMFGDPVTNPKKWNVCKLINACTKLTDGTHSSPENLPEGDFKYVTAKNIKRHGFDFSEITYINEKVHQGIYSRCNPEYGDVLYIKDGVTTGIAMVNTLREEFSLLSSVALLKPCKQKLDSHFLSELLNNDEMYTYMRKGMGGAAITRLTLKKIGDIQIPLPDLTLQNSFSSFVHRIDKLRFDIQKSLNETQKLFDSLMQEYFD